MRRISGSLRAVIAIVFGSLCIEVQAVAAEGIWIDGTAVRFQFQPYLEANPEIAAKVVPLLDRLVAVQIVPGHLSTSLYPHFEDSFVLPVADYEQTHNWRVYEVSVPRSSEFLVFGEDGVIHLEQSNQMPLWQVKAKLPMMDDTLDLNRLDIDFNKSDVKLEAGVLGNFVKVVAHAKLKGSRLSKIDVDLWESLKKNLGF